jgi:pimeloyl-ACP methyl ester carboxylesterase
MCSGQRWLAVLGVAILVGSLPVRAAPYGGLARKPASGADESYPGVTVVYDALRDAAGERLRLILTHPEPAKRARTAARFATIFVVGWLSCDTVAAPPGTHDATQLLFQSLAQLPEFATVRMDKPGVGDSEGDCAATDFTSELDAYREAFRRLSRYPFIDTGRIFILGISNGAGFAPLVPQGTAVKGYVVDGGWLKTWYEHMLEIERRRLALAGHPPSEINPLMRSVATLYSAYLLERRPPRQIFAAHPELQALWEGDAEHQYGRPVSYYQQLQDLNLMAAWSEVRVPALVLHGEFDWIMSRGDLEMTAALVNHNLGDAAQFVELPATGHSFDHYPSMEAAFAGKSLPFDPAIAQRIGGWFEQHR